MSDQEKLKKPFWKKWWFWVIVVIVLIGSIGGNDDTENESAPPTDSAEHAENQEDTAKNKEDHEVEEPTEEDESQEEPEEKPQEEPQEPTPPEALDEYLEFVINDVAGEKTNHDGEYKKRVRSVAVDPESTMVEVVANDAFTSNMIRTGIQSDSTDIFERIFQERDDDINKLIITWKFPAVDVKGNKLAGTLLIVSMTRETAESINWDNFRYSNLPKVADSYTETALLND